MKCSIKMLLPLIVVLLVVLPGTGSSDNSGSSGAVETRISLEHAKLLSATLLDDGNRFSVAGASGRVSVNRTLARSGDASLEMRLGPGETRAEAKVASIPNNTKRFAGFSVYFPQSFEPPLYWSVFAQWWQGAQTSPNIAFELDDTDSSALGMRIISRAGSSKSNLYTTHYKGELPKEQWIDFLIEFNIDDTGKEDGILRVWRDGEPIVDYTGKLGYTDQHPYSGFRIGLYRSAKNTTEAQLYFDEIFVWNL